MKIVFRNPPTSSGTLLRAYEGYFTLGEKRITKPTSPGMYYVMPFTARGNVPHHDRSRFYLISHEDLHGSRDARAGLEAEGFLGFQAVYMLSETGEELLLVNSPAYIDTDLSVTVCTPEQALMPNATLISQFINWGIDNERMRGLASLALATPTRRWIQSLQDQVDLLFAIVASIPKETLPAWAEPLVANMSVTRTLEKPFPLAVDEVLSHTAEMNALHRRHLPSSIGPKE